MPKTPSERETESECDWVAARALRKSYSSGSGCVQALRGLDLFVKRGEFLCLMGPSGSGKSTLLNLLAGLETPSDGTVRVGSQRLDLMTPDEAAVFRRRNIGVVHQFFNLIPSLTVEENVALPLLLEGKRLSQVRERIGGLLDFFGVGGYTRRRPDQLSGGEMQRVALARALIAEASLILADEPTGNLDSASGTHVLGYLRQMVDRHNVTLILATHDLTVTSYADRLLELEDGKVARVSPGGAGSSEESS